MEPNLFDKAIQLLKVFEQDSALSDLHKNSLAEATTRLTILSKSSIEIVKLNAELLEKDPNLTALRKMSNDENINSLLHEGAKDDPKLAAWLASVGGKVSRITSSAVSAYDLTKLDFSKEFPERIILLHSKTEAVYDNLWLVKTRLRGLPKFKNFNPSGLRKVRNDLQEHTEGGNSQAHIFSFGVATRGPVLRPIKPANIKAPHDIGFENNVEEFISEIEKILS